MSTFRSILNEKISRQKQLSDMLRECQLKYVDAEDVLVDSEEAQKILQVVSKSVQQQVHQRISQIVAKCLSFVFDDPYNFEVKFEQKRGKTEAVLEFSRDGLVITHPLNQIGGGAIDVASFALRLSCLILNRPALRKVLILDEPFRNIRGQEYRNRVRSLMLSLARDLDVQFIINIDHEAYPQFALGKVVEFHES